MRTPSRITATPGVALDNVPTLAGAVVPAAAAAGAGEPVNDDAPSGVPLAWAMTTGATPLAASPSVDGVGACGAFMTASVTKMRVQGQLACRIVTALRFRLGHRRKLLIHIGIYLKKCLRIGVQKSR
jgi:hypothetical protein